MGSGRGIPKKSGFAQVFRVFGNLITSLLMYLGTYLLILTTLAKFINEIPALRNSVFIMLETLKVSITFSSFSFISLTILSASVIGSIYFEAL